MFRFEHISYLQGLWLIPVLLIIFYWSYNRSKFKLNKLGQIEMLQRLMPKWNPKRIWTKHLFFCLAMVCLFIAYANPQWGYKKSKATAKSTDIYFALDISQSMLAKDVSPSRLERSKKFLLELLKELRTERIGLILFAGDAYIQVPLTQDHAAVEMFIKSANTGKSSRQGTAIGQAIELAKQSIEGEEDNYKKCLILITDGENHESEFLEAAKQALEQGMITYSIGVGTEEGDYVQIIERGYTRYKKDESGNPVRTKLNPQLIKDIALSGGGLSFVLNDDKAIAEKIKTDVEKLEKREMEQNAFKEYHSYFQYFLLAALLFLILEFVIFNQAFEKK